MDGCRNHLDNYYKQLIAIQKESINKIDDRIIYLLTKEKISMEDYNKMSEEEKINYLINLTISINNLKKR